jgi:hypothetical protein
MSVLFLVMHLKFSVCDRHINVSAITVFNKKLRRIIKVGLVSKFVVSALHYNYTRIKETNSTILETSYRNHTTCIR